MKFFTCLFLLSWLIPAQAKSPTVEKKSPYKYLATQANSVSKDYQHNQFEQIMSGGLAFLIGNIGFYTTGSQTLKLAYSGVQTIGILSVGQGIYDYYSPNFDGELLKLLKREKLTKSRLADGFLEILGKEERAKRLSLLYGSGLLTIQYATNAYFSGSARDIKDIYLFLAGINVIVFNYAYFTRDKYEAYLELDETAWKMAPSLSKDAVMLGFNRSF